jgi:glyoxylase-like metal-dependent hydrolase (beta-lactamase superfamily II)
MRLSTIIPDAPMPPIVTPFFHAPTGTWTYVVEDPQGRQAAVVDPVLDYDWRSARTGTASAQAVLDHLRARGLELVWILETHAHADHLSGAAWLQSQAGGKIAIGEGIRAVQATFKRIFGLGEEFVADGGQFDRLLADGEALPLGTLEGRVLATPGHTSDSVSYLFGDALFVGDTVFMPDGGSARCDFPGGDAAELYRSVQRLYALPPETRVFVCHDYAPGGRAPLCETTLRAQREGNIHLRADTPETEFVAMRRTRDATLDVPNLIIPSVQVNIRAGRLPPAEPDGVSYLKVPMDRIGRPLPTSNR